MIPITKDVMEKADGWIYGHKLYASIKWPPVLSLSHHDYIATGKQGITAEGIPSAEYEGDKGERIWLLADGRVRPE